MKQRVLNGSEVAGFIQDRQQRMIRGLRHTPRLAIVRTNNDPVTSAYLAIKERYATAIGAQVEIIQTTEQHAKSAIIELNGRSDVHGIIVQLPLADPVFTGDLLDTVAPSKDVDGLAKVSQFDPATPTAILWLLAAYNVELSGEKVLVVGQGKLVGGPLTRMLLQSGVDVLTADDTTLNLDELCKEADIIVTATGSPRIIHADMVKPGAVIVDAGTASEGGVLIGDVAEDVRQRQDVSITPVKGGVGPLTVAALFENLLQAAR